MKMMILLTLIEIGIVGVFIMGYQLGKSWTSASDKMRADMQRIN